VVIGDNMGQRDLFANKTTILRKRVIPEEVVDISDDEIIYRDDRVLATKWKAIKPRPDLFGGISVTYLKEGYKISRFFDEAGKFLYWYCDFLEVDYDIKNDKYLLTDLLVDIKVMPEGEVRILDITEFAQALEQGLITTAQAGKALRAMDLLLDMIRRGEFPPAECLEYNYD